jgi:2-desacetyl-2-hydroxyethyl bacteriochlorophyllide A dehydrogenase
VHRDGGSFAERIAVPVGQLLRLPANLQNQSGALVEPLAVGVHATRRAGMRPGMRVAVVGAGTVGTLVAQVARALEASTVVLADRLQERWQLCRDLGFESFVHVGAESLEERLSSFVPGYDVIFDNACTRDTIGAAIRCLRPDGKLVLLGFPHDRSDVPLAYADAYKWEVSITLSRNYAREDFLDAISLLEKGAIDTQRMITGTWPLAEFDAAYNELRAHPGRHVKVLLAP